MLELQQQHINSRYR